jgi:peptide/nickel transport system permease protein
MNFRETISKFKKIIAKEKLASFWIGILMFLGIFGALIASEKPLYYEGKSPLVGNLLYQIGIGNYNEDFKISSSQHKNGAVYTLIPYATTTIDTKNSGSIGPLEHQDVSSLNFRHWMGTDDIGRDVFAGIIHGCTTAILIGFGAVFIAFLFGLFIGILSGYLGNTGFLLNLFCIIILPILIFVIYWISFEMHFRYAIMYGIITSTISYFFLSKINRLQQKKYTIPVDLILMRIIEILHTIPSLLLIIVICGIVPKSGIGTIIFIIAFVSWGQFAKVARADTLKTKETDYVIYAKQAGISNFKIMLHHILPNILTNSVQLMIMRVPSAILAESVLSFIGIGFGPEHVSWGSILAQSKSNMGAWWLFLFPTIFLIFTTLSINRIGRRLRKE